MLDIYILENCPYCNKVMEHLKEKNVTYNKIDTKNEENALKLLTIGGKDQVPFLYNSQNNDKIYESDRIIEYINKISEGKNET